MDLELRIVATLWATNRPSSRQGAISYSAAVWLWGVAGELLFRVAAGHVTLLHSVLGLAQIEVVVADPKGIGAG
jgi:hypothetical protein